jgi:hypothetical protein
VRSDICEVVSPHSCTLTLFLAMQVRVFLGSHAGKSSLQGDASSQVFGSHAGKSSLRGDVYFALAEVMLARQSSCSQAVLMVKRSSRVPGLRGETLPACSLTLVAIRTSRCSQVSLVRKFSLLLPSSVEDASFRALKFHSSGEESRAASMFHDGMEFPWTQFSLPDEMHFLLLFLL